MAEDPEYRYAATERRQSMKDNKVRLFSAGCLSSAIPGVGQFFRGQVTRGLLWASAYILFLLGTFLLRPWHDPDDMMAAILAGAGLMAAAAVDAAFIRTQQDVRATKWSVVLFVCIAFIASLFANQSVWKVDGYKLLSVLSQSMEPTLKVPDSVVADLHTYRRQTPKRGEIVVINSYEDSAVSLKRVIAIPGDTIEGKNGQITLNNVAIQESYVPAGRTAIDVSSSTDESMKKLYTFGPVKLGPGEYFLMGDNRGLSYDSRITGPVRMNAIAGKALYIINKKDDSRDGKRLD